MLSQVPVLIQNERSLLAMLFIVSMYGLRFIFVIFFFLLNNYEIQRNYGLLIIWIFPGEPWVGNRCLIILSRPRRGIDNEFICIETFLQKYQVI